MVFKLAHFSDPHLGPLPPVRVTEILNKRLFGYLSWLRGRRALHRPEVLAALAEDLEAEKPDHLVITGDLTNIALVEEFSRVEAWLHGLGSPDHISVIPGNHDAYIAVPWEVSLAKWQKFMTGETEAGGTLKSPTGPESFPFVRYRGPVAVVGLSSAQPTPLFCAHGTLGEAQLDRLGSELRRLGRENWFRVVLVHHPPSLNGIAWRKRLVDADAFRRVIAECGAELVLHGHNHTVGEERIDSGASQAPVLGVPSASAAFGGKKPLARYNIYSISGEAGEWRIETTARGLDPATGRFKEVGRYETRD